MLFESKLGAVKPEDLEIRRQKIVDVWMELDAMVATAEIDGMVLRPARNGVMASLWADPPDLAQADMWTARALLQLYKP